MPAVQHQQRLPPVDQVGDSEEHDDAVHYISHQSSLYILSGHSYVQSLIKAPCERDACANQLPHRIASSIPPLSPHRKPPRPLMATLTYSHDAQSAFGAPPGSPPDLTNSKSSKSSSIHSSTLLDFMGTTENLSHFEDINLDEASGGPSAFPMPVSPSNRLVFEAPRAAHSTRSLPHSHRDLTGTVKPKYPSLKGQVNHAVQRQHAQLSAPGKLSASPSVPSLSSLSLAAPHRSSRSPSPSNTRKSSPAARTLSRRSSHNLDTLPSPGVNVRRQSWQDSKRKTVKEREAECDDEDDELPEEAVIWNVPMSPRPTTERSPVSWVGEISPQTSPNPGTMPSSSKTSPAPPMSRRAQRSPSPHISSRGVSPQPPPQQTTWAETYTALDPDARKLTEALEEYQSELERKQEITRQQPGLARSQSLNQRELKSKKPALPPVRKSDPLIDPFQPSAEKQKYLSRTRPSWLPPKNPKEEKKHLKEYQRMLARIEEAGKSSPPTGKQSCIVDG